MSRAVDNSDIVVRLLQHMDLQDAARWLSTPHPDLEGLTPEGALARGLRNEVERLCAALIGAPVESLGSRGPFHDSQSKGSSAMSTRSAVEEIQRIAYELWQIEGEPEGRDRDHWERATRIHASRSSAPEVTATLEPHTAEPSPTTGVHGCVALPAEDAAAGTISRDPQGGADAANVSPEARQLPDMEPESRLDS